VQICFIRHGFVNFHTFQLIGIGSTTNLLTSMKNKVDVGTDWLGDLAAAFIPPTDTQKTGDCLGLSSLGITGMDCNAVSDFICQAPDPPGAVPFPSMRFNHVNKK
jgi:hypothetical protein